MNKIKKVRHRDDGGDGGRNKDKSKTKETEQANPAINPIASRSQMEANPSMQCN